MEIIGKVIQALPLQSGVSKTGSNWQLQTYIIETQETYPRKVAIELFNRNADQYKCNIGDMVTVSFDLESREFNGRWYTSVRAWRIDHNAGQQPTDGTMPIAAQAPAPQPTAVDQPAAAAPAAPTVPTTTFTAEPEENSDLPF